MPAEKKTAKFSVVEIIDDIERTHEFTKAFAAIEQLLLPWTGVGDDSLKNVDRDNLSSLIRIVNVGLMEHLIETVKTARLVEDGIGA